MGRFVQVVERVLQGMGFGQEFTAAGIFCPSFVAAGRLNKIVFPGLYFAVEASYTDIKLQ